MKKKINERAGSKKKSKKQLKKKPLQQIIVIEKKNGNKEGVTFTNWATLLSENQELL